MTRAEHPPTSTSQNSAPETFRDEPAPTEVRAFEVGHGDAGERVDRLLASAWSDISRSRLKQLIEDGCLAADGATIAEPSTRVKAGWCLQLRLPEPAPARPEAQAMNLKIVYDDDAVIVVDKPAGLVVHPAPGNPKGTLVNALIAHCGDSLQGIGGERRPGIVHRLDKETSGLIVAAKTQQAHEALVQQFSARTIDRSYLAVCWGLLAPTSGRLTGAIGRSPRNRKKMAVVKQGGREAATRYRTLEVLASGAASLVECRLETGRTHQIRVHLTEAGHPLLGDPLYGRTQPKAMKLLGIQARATVDRFNRQALHAATLAFTHPQTGERLSFESPLPADLQGLIAALRAAS